MDLPSLKNDITGSEPTVKKLDILQKSQVQDIKIGRAIADPASGFLDRKRKKSCSCHFYTYM